MGLLDLVEQQHAVWMSTHLFGQLSTFAVSHIARRSSDQSADVVLLGVFAHVDSDHLLFTAEQVFCQLFGNMGLPDAGRAYKEKNTDRTVALLESGSAAKNCTGNFPYRFVLSDDYGVEASLHIEQTGLFIFGQTCDRNAGHRSDNLADRLFVDFDRSLGQLVPPLSLHLFETTAKGTLSVAKCGGNLIMLHLYRPVSVLGGLRRFTFQIGQRFRGFAREKLGATARFIHYVDRLVREKAVRKVTARQVDTCPQRLFRIANAVVYLVPVLDVGEDAVGLLVGGLFDEHLLKTTFQCTVCFDRFPVLVQCCGSDTLQFSPGQSWFQNVGRIE